MTTFEDVRGSHDRPGRCATCMHWEQAEGFDRAAAAYGDDDAVYPLEHGVCRRILVEGNDERARHSAPDGHVNPVIAFPTFRDGGLVMSHARFGCTLWAERDTAPTA